MTLFRNFFSCVRGNRSHRHRIQARLTPAIKVKLGVPLARHDNQHLAAPLLKLVIFLAREGAYANDLFRRPGNMHQVANIIKLLSQGKSIQWSVYNLYTAANVAKKFLLSIPGGLFGRRGEEVLMATGELQEELRIQQFLQLVRNMDPASRELTVILFGILFRMVNHAVLTTQPPPTSSSNDCPPTPPPSPAIGQFYHTKPPGSPPSAESPPSPPLSPAISNPLSPVIHGQYINSPNLPTSASIVSHSVSTISSLSFASNRQAVLSEAVAKSVAGSLFHTCRDSPDKIEMVVPILQSLIMAFPSFDMDFIDFFDQTVNKLSISNSSTGSSSRELSLSSSQKANSGLSRKRSCIAASIEMWTENLTGKSTSQRSSLKEASSKIQGNTAHSTALASSVLGSPTNIFQHYQRQHHQLIQQQHQQSLNTASTQDNKLQQTDTVVSPSNTYDNQSQYQPNINQIPSIKITSPSQSELSVDFIEPCNSRPDPPQIRAPQDRLRSMKRRHQANLERRAQWFLSSIPTPVFQLPSQQLFRHYHQDEERDSSDMMTLQRMTNKLLKPMQQSATTLDTTAVDDDDDNDYDSYMTSHHRLHHHSQSIVVVTCGGSSICLGQNSATSTNVCYCYCGDGNSNLGNPELAVVTSSGPDLVNWQIPGQHYHCLGNNLTTTATTTSASPNSISSQRQYHRCQVTTPMETTCFCKYTTDQESLATVSMRGDDSAMMMGLYDTISGHHHHHDTNSVIEEEVGDDEEDDRILLDNQEEEEYDTNQAQEPAPNSVPLARRMLPSRSSTSSRKNSRAVPLELYDDSRIIIPRSSMLASDLHNIDGGIIDDDNDDDDVFITTNIGDDDDTAEEQDGDEEEEDLYNVSIDDDTQSNFY